MSKEEELGIGKSGRKVDMKEEYYVCEHFYFDHLTPKSEISNDSIQRLSAKDLDDWEQKRVKRLPGEHDGVI